MAIVNVTPDSFAESAAHRHPDAAAELALEMASAGADLIDIGGESTRPGATPVGADEELARVLPVLRMLAGRVAVPISIDTYKADVARAAVAAGASIVNDVSGLRFDPELAHAVSESGAALVLMHSRGRPETMNADAVYTDVVAEVTAELRDGLQRAARPASRSAHDRRSGHWVC
jgi:dihydropteroate synthase